MKRVAYFGGHRVVQLPPKNASSKKTALETVLARNTRGQSSYYYITIGGCIDHVDGVYGELGLTLPLDHRTTHS